MESAVRPSAPRAHPSRRDHRARAGGSAAGTTAILLATAPADDGGAAAALRFEGATLLGRLLAQLGDLGIRDAHLITRPEWVPALEPDTAGSAVAVRVHACADTAADLRTVAQLAGAGGNALVLLNADILTQREALAGLLADPRVPTGMLTTTIRRIHRFVGFRTRTRRGRVVSAGSPFHYIHQANGTFLGVLKIAPDRRGDLAAAATRLAELVDGELPAGWRAELEAKAERWKLAIRRRTLRRLAEPGVEPAADDDEPPQAGAEDVALSPEEQAELERRLAAAERDVPSLLLVGLVRSGVQVGGSHLRKLFWARPLAQGDLEEAAAAIVEHDEDRALLDSAVKANDGFFTTFFVSPYSKYIARWAARRGWTPNGVTTLSVGIGFAAAAGFATGERWGMVLGAILLQLAFTFDCVDGQLARYTRTFTKLGAWLDSIFDRTKEYAVFAGLAIGASRTGDDVWLLAGAALALQTMRHAIDFSYPQVLHQAIRAERPPPLEQAHDGIAAPALIAEGEPDSEEPPQPPAPPPPPTLKRRVRDLWRRIDRSSRGRWAKKIIGFPIGERFAAISLSAALFDARVTFIVLLAWGGFAAAYTLAGRVLRSLGRRAGTTAAAPAAPGNLEAFRDDGPLALLLGRLAPPLPAGPLVLAGLLPLLAAAAFAGAGASWWLAAAAIAWLVLAGGVTAGRPMGDPMRWIAPPALRVAEYAAILWVAAIADAVPAAVALLLAVTYRHYDIVYRLRHRGVTPPTWLNRLALGWDGRVIAACALAAAGAAPAAYWIAAGLLAVVFAAETVAGWASFERSRQPDVYEDEEEDAE